MSYIKIENELVTVINESVERSVRLEDWLPLIEKRSPVLLPVLPQSTRAIWWDPTDIASQKLMLMMEQQPQTIRLNMQGHTKVLSIPWTRFVFYASTPGPTRPLSWRLEDYRIFWSKNRYQDPSAHDMIKALLPNVYGDGRICFGSTGARADQSLADRLDQTVNEFYISAFNHDLGIDYPNRWRGFAPWIRMTERNPNAWMDWPDWESGRFGEFSWNTLNEGYFRNTTSRLDEVIATNGIPPLQTGATFGRVEEWIAGLNNNQRARLYAVSSELRAMAPEEWLPIAEPDSDTEVDPEEPENTDDPEADEGN